MQALLGFVLMGAFLLAIWWMVSPRKCNICSEMSYIWDTNKGGKVCFRCQLQQRKAEVYFSKQGNLQNNIMHLKLELNCCSDSLMLQPSSKSIKGQFCAHKGKNIETGLNPGSLLDYTA